MANCCNYEVRVKGSKQAGLMVYKSMPCLDYKEIEWEKGTDSLTIVCFTGNCKWSVNFGVTDSLERVNVDSMNDSEIEEKGADYWEYSLRAKSEAFECEVMVHYWSEESGFDQFDHYKNGKLLKQRKIAFNYAKQDEFDWEKLEFVGHEGEYDESVDGEEQDKNFMDMILGINEMLAPCEPQVNENDDISLAKLMDAVSQLQDLLVENGVDLGSTSIGDTGFDMYKWTFTEGKIIKGNGWTIAIPDGFEKVKSKDLDATGKLRLFELVPVTYISDETYEAPVCVMSGAVLSVNALGDNWMVHPNARAGVAGIVGIESAQGVLQMTGIESEMLSTGWSDVAAHIMVQDTAGGSYSYQIAVFTEKKTQTLRVQTHHLSDDQKYELGRSIIKWLHTMKFDKPNKACPTKTKMEEDSLYDELMKKGVTKEFNEAVKQAEIEYQISITGKIKMLEFMAENGRLDSYAADYLREIMMDGMAVREYYLEKTDALIKKLQEAGVEPNVLQKMFKKLHDLDTDTTHYLLNDEKIEIEVSKRVNAIRNEWKKLEVQDWENQDEISLPMKFEQLAHRRNELEEVAKGLRKSLSNIKARRTKEESSFNAKMREIERTISDGFYIDSYNLEGQIRNIINTATKAGKKLNETCVDLIRQLDEQCRPYLEEGMDPQLIKDIASEMEELNESAIVNINFQGLVDGYTTGYKSNIHYEPTKETKKIESYWSSKAKSAKEVDREAKLLKELGISKNDYQRHCDYETTIEKYKKATTAKQMKQIQAAFKALKGYLDSEDYVQKCERAISNLIAKEEKEAAEEEERAREAAEKLRIYEEKYEEWLTQKKEIEAFREHELKTAVDAFREALDIELQQWYLQESQRLSETEISNYKKKAEVEEELSTLGLFKFKEKSACKQSIQQAETILSGIPAEKARLNEMYQNKKSDVEKKVYLRTKGLKAQIEKENPIPAEPQKPAPYKPASKRTKKKSSK